MKFECEDWPLNFSERFNAIFSAKICSSSNFLNIDQHADMIRKIA